MAALIIAFAIVLGILYLAGWVVCSTWTATPFLEATMGDGDNYEERGGWIRVGLGRILIWMVATGLPIAILIAIAQAQPPDTHGSCKIGHYEAGAKGQQVFYCDEWYPPPQVKGQ